MDRQTVLLIALATLAVAGLVVSVTGWMHFARDRKVAAPAGEEATPESAPEVGDPAGEAEEAHPAEP